MASSSDRSEKKDITIAKGVAILLVVVGHILARGASDDNEWFTTLTRLIYRFHMPFFMALSGYLFFRPGRAEKIYSTFDSFIRKQFMRLILPFFALGLLVLFGKLALQGLVHVDNTPASFTSGFRNLFWTTKESPSTFIWYVYVLFIYSAITPIFFRYVKNPFLWAIVLGIALQFVPPVYIAYLDLVTPFFLFFVVGGWLRQHEQRYIGYLRKFGTLFLIAFLVSFQVADLPDFDHKRLVIGLFSIPALHWVSLLLADFGGWAASGFYVLGQRTLFIYLFNTICIGVTKAIIFLATNWHGTNFYWVAPVLITAGIVGPIVIETVFAQVTTLWRRRPGRARPN